MPSVRKSWSWRGGPRSTPEAICVGWWWCGSSGMVSRDAKLENCAAGARQLMARATAHSSTLSSFVCSSAAVSVSVFFSGVSGFGGLPWGDGFAILINCSSVAVSFVSV